MIAVDGDTVITTRDGVWFSVATRSDTVAWEIETPAAPSYVPAILAWADGEHVDADALERIEREADAIHAAAPAMHDTRVDIMVSAAFNGMGDATGSDDYGRSVAWLDLADHIVSESELLCYGSDVLPAGVDYWSVGAYLATWRDVSGCRYVLAYLDADGARSAVGYRSHADMMAAYRAIEADYLAWEESADSQY